MNNAFQEQLLKAGVVNKQQVQKAQQEKKNKKKQQGKKNKHVDEATIKAREAARQAAEKKTQHDRELNRKKQEQAKRKAISAEINQLILDNLIKRDDDCEIAYNFEHQQKVKRIYINAEMKQQVVSGKLGIARIDGRYELVPLSVAEKIQQRNEKRIIIFKEESVAKDENDPYADYEIPDDLIW